MRFPPAKAARLATYIEHTLADRNPASLVNRCPDERAKLERQLVMLGGVLADRCTSCGRRLTDPESLARRIGPDCFARGVSLPARRQGAGDGAWGPGPGMSPPPASAIAALLADIDARRRS